MRNLLITIICKMKSQNLLCAGWQGNINNFGRKASRNVLLKYLASMAGFVISGTEYFLSATSQLIMST
jgi:hypothetical protein